MRVPGKWLMVVGTSVLGFSAGAATGFLTLDRGEDEVTGTEDHSLPRRLVRATAGSKDQGKPDAEETASIHSAFEPVSPGGGNVLGDTMLKYLRVITEAQTEDFPRLMEEALRMFGQDGVYGTILVPQIAKRWVEADPAGAVKAFYSGRLAQNFDFHDPFGAGYDLVLTVLDRALEIDPAAVSEILIENPHVQHTDIFLDRIIQFEARTDATQAFEIIDRLAVPGLRSFAIDAILARGKDSTLFPNGPNDQALSRTEVLALMMRYPGIMAGNERMTDAFESYANRDLRGALELAEGLQPGEHRDDALWGAIKEWGHRGFEAALAYVESISSPVLRSELSAKLFNSFHDMEPGTEAERALEIPSRHQRNTTLAQIVGNWVADDSASALAWMDANLAPPQWEAAATDILEQRRGRRISFQSFAELAERLPPESKPVAQFVRNWERSDRESLEEWIGSKPVLEQPQWRAHLTPESPSPNDSPIPIPD